MHQNAKAFACIRVITGFEYTVEKNKENERMAGLTNTTYATQLSAKQDIILYTIFKMKTRRIRKEGLILGRLR